MPRITIANLGCTINAGTGSLLDAALDAGLPFPHGCRSGSCGACESLLLEGLIDLEEDGTCEYAPADEERFLACRARARTDVSIAWLGEEEGDLPPIQKRAGTVLRVDRVGRDVLRLQLDVGEAGFAYLPGQYAEVAVPGRPARKLSMAGSPDDSTIEFHVRHFPDGALSHYVASRLRPGDPVRIRGPFGVAYLRDHALPLLAVAGGVGLAPIRSIVLAARRRDPDRPIHLYHGVRDEDDLYCAEEFERLSQDDDAFRFVPVLSDPTISTTLQTGLVHEAVAADFPSLAGYVVHSAGPPPMVAAVQTLAQCRGAEERHILSDPFVAHGASIGRLRRLAWPLTRLRSFFGGLERP